MNEKKLINVDLLQQQPVKIFTIPSVFSLTKSPKETYQIIHELFYTLYYEKAEKILIDYKDCERIDIDAQVYLDIILKYFIAFFNAKIRKGFSSKVVKIGGINIVNEEIEKILYSVGSVAIHNNEKKNYTDVIDYNLCIGCRKKINSSQKKEIDTTNLVDYVLKCLETVNKKLTAESRSDLCQVIGEVLINAEEHSTTNYRYSIGYFQHKYNNDKHYGIFNLVILNYGDTIYEKFKSPVRRRLHLRRRCWQDSVFGEGLLSTPLKTEYKNNSSYFSSKGGLKPGIFPFSQVCRKSYQS